MRMQNLLGPCLGVCLMLAGIAAQAEDENSESAPAAAGVRTHIDGKTGKKTPSDDSDLAQAGTRAAAPGAQAAAASRQAAELARISARIGMPVDSQAPVRNADGSLSARVGLKEMTYLVMTIDKDGKRSVSHRTLDELSVEEPAAAPDSGEK